MGRKLKSTGGTTVPGTSSGVFPPVAGGALTISTAPTIAGDAVVGQTLYATNGTYGVTPDSISGQWYKDGSAISGETASSYLIVDADAGSLLAWKETATKAGYANSSLNASANTGTIANISLTSAITAFTRTSSSGVTPMLFSVTFGSNVYSGYTLRARVYSDSGLTTQTQEVFHTLTAGDMAGGAIDFASDGLTAIAATYWLQLSVQVTSPNGTFYEYVHSTALSPTDAAVAMTWSTSDKEASVTLSGGNLIASRGGGYAGLRSSRGVSASGKYYCEFSASYSGTFGIADSTQSLTTEPVDAWQGGTASTHAGVYQANGPNIFYNTTYVAGTVWPGGSNVIGMALDLTVSPPKVYFRLNSGSWMNSADPVAGTGGMSLTSIGATLFPFAWVGGGNSVTLNPGTTPGGTAGFTHTPPTGFVAP